MRLGRVARGTSVAVVVAASWAVVPALVQAQQGKSPLTNSPKFKADTRKERASGVITKVERVTKGAAAGSTIRKETDAGRNHAATHRLTINTNAVWRDWARDQAQMQDRGSARKDAAKGDNSVATKGEPVDANSLVVVDIGPETRIETRFRSPDDETTKGARTPDAVGGEDRKSDGRRKPAADAVHFRASDLKAGLFVEVDFRHVTAQNPASSVTVIRPIGGPDASPKAGSIDAPKSK